MLEVKGLSKRFPIEGGFFQVKGFVRAAQDISFAVAENEIVALVGESGSGKSTVAKMIQGLIEPTSGDIIFEEKNATTVSRRTRAQTVQMIFQDPYASLNPKLSVGTMLEEALSISDIDVTPNESSLPKLSASELLKRVGLATNILHDYPHQFSGGQRQRLGIARALAARPKLVICDEPVSALDLSVQAQILNLLTDLKEEFGISYLLISHDLSIVEHMADRILIMQSGRIVEEGNVKDVFENPKQAYSQKLLSSAFLVN